ncbi:hypothetical protein CSQ96_02535 [Janthinobacterium sp. BJB412]|nr:hypothetical protein CSQ96_02535 [Janthinobacterium sp. BJB412]
MARQIEEFVLAWSALSGGSEGQGWRTIPITSAGSCSLMAGRCFPSNEEVLLAGFLSAPLPIAEKLPEGLGFSVSRVDPHKDGKTWIALTRKVLGSPDIFAKMVADVVGAMDAMSTQSDETILRALLSRLRAWQEFMRKGQQSLSPEAEIGLMGELSVLGWLIAEGIPVGSVIDGWVGPLDGVQDFELGTGAIEVKSTLSSIGFPAKIGSLEQLDNSIRQPLFIAGLRFSLRDSGITLPELVASLRQSIADDGEAFRVFGDRLLAACFQDAQADHYIRRFVLEGARILEVAEGFPRLVSGTIPAGIRRAVYEIDLDRAEGIDVSVIEALTKLGAL